MARTADAVAGCVIDTFRGLPAKFKPRRTTACREWTTLAGIVLSKGTHRVNDCSFHLPSSMQCVALATGLQCHPHSRLPQLQGSGLHDWHAEILALRAFNRFLLDECADLASGALGKGSDWLEWKRDAEQPSSPPFALRDDVAIHMFCSEAPCGDASMELTMAKQQDATPWSAAAPTPVANDSTSEPSPTVPLLGRGHFDQLGRVRRKPSRPDAPTTRSKSCSDKLALKQCTGLLSAITAHLIRPRNVYLSTLVLPESEYVPAACERAFGRQGRMAPVCDPGVQERWSQSDGDRDAGFAFVPFAVQTTSREFEYSKRFFAMKGRNDDDGLGASPVPSNRSCMYTTHACQVLINGALEGRRWDDVRGASQVSRREMWKSAVGIAVALGSPASLSSLTVKTRYGNLKQTSPSKARERVKSDARELALSGWLQNDGDDEWTLTDEEWTTLGNSRIQVWPCSD